MDITNYRIEKLEKPFDIPDKMFDALYDLSMMKNECRGFSFIVSKSSIKERIKDIKADFNAYDSESKKELEEEIAFLGEIIGKMKTKLLLIDRNDF